MTPVNFTEKCKGRKVGGGFEVPRLRAFILKNPPVVYKHFIGVRESERPSGAGETCGAKRSGSFQNSGMDRCHVAACVGRKRRLLLTILHIQRDGKGCFVVLFCFLMLGGFCLRKGPGFQIPTPNISVCVKSIKTSKQKRCL